MMNKCNFLVRLVKDVDLRYSPAASMHVATFVGAVDKRNAKKLKEQGKDSANFIRFKAFGKNAENISQYFKQGDLITLTASYETGKYKNSKDEMVYTQIFHVEEWGFVPSQSKQSSQAEPKLNDDFSFGGLEEIENDDDVPF